MPLAVISTPEFDRDIKKLKKSYHAVVETVRELILQLENGERPGNQIQEVGLTVYKVRLPNRSARRGKSGGFRVYYLVRPADRTASIALITIRLTKMTSASATFGVCCEMCSDAA